MNGEQDKSIHFSNSLSYRATLMSILGEIVTGEIYSLLGHKYFVAFD